MKFLKFVILLMLFPLGTVNLLSQTTETIYLSGKGPADAVEWDFFCSEGRRSGEWTRIPVPSNWEQHGFGGYDYGHILPEEKHAETGTYKTTFKVPEDWKDRYVRLVFEGSMTETAVKVNGKPVGTPHQGGYLPFRIPLNSPQAYNNNCLRYGEVNELEVTVSKKPSNTSLDIAERKADYWVFGGIYRPVYLEVLPKFFINRLAIDARADGNITVDVFPQAHQILKFRGVPDSKADLVEAQVMDKDGNKVGETFSAPVYGAGGKIRLSAHLPEVSAWSTEDPTLYHLRVQLKNKGEVIHEIIEEFGFRTFEVREGDGLYLNGKKLKIKGVNRNVMHPETARSINKEDAWSDARLIKEMNANLVRSHLPPTREFMRACDHLGLLVITELTNWQKPFIDAPLARNLVYELVTYYQNHPSVIIWANGNEGGFNIEVDELYPLLDIQQRPVIHPWGVFDGIDALHYPNYEELLSKSESHTIYLPTEVLHGLYDGGHGAGLEDYWNWMMETPIAAGGVLWCWADAAVKRTDMDGYLDTDGNHSADGIVGPYREKEASYHTIREIWSPVQLETDGLPEAFNGGLPASFSGKIPVRNHYLYTSLDQCSFEWSLLNVEQGKKGRNKEAHAGVEEIGAGTFRGPAIDPGAAGEIQIPLPGNRDKADILELTAFDPRGMEIMQWSWPLGSIDAPSFKSRPKSRAKPVLINGTTVAAGDIQWVFNEQTGLLEDCLVRGKSIGLGEGPVLYTSIDVMAAVITDENGNEIDNAELNWHAIFSEKDETVVVESRKKEDGSWFKWIIEAGGAATLSYDFKGPTVAVSYGAVGFDLPESAVVSKMWLGKGPHRIWANRLKGPQFGLWENDSNDVVPGIHWDYPAFRGVFCEVDWMQLELQDGITLVVDPVEKSDIGVLRPSNMKEAVRVLKRDEKNFGPKKAVWDYPESGGLYMFHVVPAIGTKFKWAKDLGPQSMEQKLERIQGEIRFSLVN